MEKKFMEAIMKDETISEYLKSHKIDEVLGEADTFLEVFKYVFHMMWNDFNLIINGGDPFYMRNNTDNFVKMLKFVIVLSSPASSDDEALSIVKANVTLIKELIETYALLACEMLDDEEEDVEED